MAEGQIRPFRAEEQSHRLETTDWPEVGGQEREDVGPGDAGAGEFLPPWARLSDLQTESGTAGRSVTHFRLALDLPGLLEHVLAPALLEGVDLRARMRVREGGFHLALQLPLRTGSSWISVEVQLQPGLGGVRVRLSSWLGLGPSRCSLRSLLAMLRSDLEGVLTPGLQEAEGLIRVATLLARAVHQEAGGDGSTYDFSSLWITAGVENPPVPTDASDVELSADPGRNPVEDVPCQLILEGISLLDAGAVSWPRAQDGDALQRLELGAQLEARLDAQDWSGARRVLTLIPAGGALQARAALALLTRAPGIRPEVVQMLRREAEQGSVEARAAVIERLLREGQPLRASIWLSGFGERTQAAPLLSWAAEGARRDLEAQTLGNGGEILARARTDLEALRVRYGRPSPVGGGSAAPGAAAGVDSDSGALEQLQRSGRGGTGPTLRLLKGRAPVEDRTTSEVGVDPAGDTPVPGPGPAGGQEDVRMPFVPDAEEFNGDNRGGGSPLADGLTTSLPVSVPETPAVSEAAKDLEAPVRLERPITRVSLDALRERFEAREDWRGLLELLEAALSTGPGTEEIVLLQEELAQLLIALGVPSRAAPHYEALLDANPDHQAGLTFLRSFYLREALHTERLNLEARLALRQPPREAARQLDGLAREAAERRLPELERRFLSRACELEPTDRGLLERLTVRLEAIDDWDGLVEIWRRHFPLIVQPVERREAGLRIASYLRAQGSLRAAERLYRGLLRREPEQPEAIEGLIAVLEAREEWAEVAEHLQRLSRLRKGEARVAIAQRLAELYGGVLEDEESAQAWSREALVEAGSSAQGARGLLKSLESAEDWKGMAALLESMIRTEPGPAARHELLIHLGDIYLVRLQAQARAQECFRQAEALAQTHRLQT